MNQVLETKTKSNLYQDFVFPRRKSSLDTLVIEASCYVCNKGLEDGYAVTAKNTVNGTLLFCDKHFRMN